MNITFEHLYYSTMPRAEQTAQVIVESLQNDIQSTPDTLLQEGVPCRHDPPALYEHWYPQERVCCNTYTRTHVVGDGC